MEGKSGLPLGLEEKKERKEKQMWKYGECRKVMEKGEFRKKQGRRRRSF